MLNKGILLFIVFTLICSSAFAQLSDLAQNNLSVEWQAIKLQESIENKIGRSLTPIIDRNDYIIEVKIGIDQETAEDPSSKKVTKTIQSKKVRFSTVDLPKDGDDFVIFNKLGLEAPIIGDEATETQTSEVELAQKAMIEMSDRFNLFNFMTTIDIKLTFEKSISDVTKENIKNIVNGLSFNTKDVIPQINIQYLDLKNSKVKSAAQLTAPAADKNSGNGKSEVKNDITGLPKTSLAERFKNLDIMLGLVLSSLILGIVALMISKNGSKVESQQENVNENKETPEDLVENLTEEEPIEELNDELSQEEIDMGFDLSSTDAQTLKISQTLERFRKVLGIHYNDSILMIKNWIKTSKVLEISALRALVEVLEDDELKDIYKALTHDERSTWKMNLDDEMTKAEMSKAFIFINSQIINMMMVPSLIDDYEICDLLLDLSPENAAKFCMQNPGLGVVFANILSANTIGEMFKIMPHEMTIKIIENSALFQHDELVNQLPILKEKLLELKNKREKPPFINRIVDILPTANPEIEQKLYATLLNHMGIDDVLETAMKILPWDVVGLLPDGLFKELISTLPMDFQVQYFISLGDNKRESELARFASKGSKSREMIDVEMSVILKNDIMVKRIEGDRKFQIQTQFVKYARKFVSENAESQKSVTPIVLDWFNDIKRDQKKHAESKMTKIA